MRARVERLGEPALLLLLDGGPTHGYELLERLPTLVGEERVDVGNVYRALRGLEDEGLVVSEWQAELPGPAKRTYTLTDRRCGRARRLACARSASCARACRRFSTRREGR